MIDSSTPPVATHGRIEIRHLHPEFRGSAGEYFKIWIVNTLLTLLTLGFYLPWAKVRTRRYFYLNTRLGDEPFDYVADPKRLLYGYMVIGIFLIAYNLLPTINPLLALPIFVLGFILFPWIIYKSRRFFCHNSTYRNVRFRFLGECGGAYSAYIGYPLLASLTLGIMWPHAFFKQREYFFSNVAFGNVPSHFEGTAGYFYKVYYAAFALGILLMVGLGASMGGLVAFGNEENFEQAAGAFMLLPLAFYAVFFLIFQFVNVKITNYCWNQTRFPGHLAIRCDIKPLKYIWIQFTNILAILLSVGFLMPWAKVRLYRYRISCFTTSVTNELDEVIGVQQAQDDGAVGEMGADQFDFEIGL